MGANLRIRVAVVIERVGQQQVVQTILIDHVGPADLAGSGLAVGHRVYEPPAPVGDRWHRVEHQRIDVDDNKDLVDDACAKRAAAELTRD